MSPHEEFPIYLIQVQTPYLSFRVLRLWTFRCDKNSSGPLPPAPAIRPDPPPAPPYKLPILYDTVFVRKELEAGRMMLFRGEPVTRETYYELLKDYNRRFPSKK